MKKVISVLLLTALLAGLCACSVVEDNNPTTTQAPTEACDHQYTEAVTKAATCTEEGVTTFTCSKCKDTYTEPIKMRSHSNAGATCTTPKTCVICGTEQGKAKGHDYLMGACIVCDAAQPDYKALGSHSWEIAGLTFSEEELDVIVLSFGGEDGDMISASFWGPLETLSEKRQEEYLKNPDSLYVYKRDQYYPLGFGDWRYVTFEEENDEAIIYILEDGGAVATITLERKSVDKYTITQITGRIIDDIVTSCLEVGGTFTVKE